MCATTYSWETDAPEVCRLIANSPTLLRVILKTKDDEMLIERWIRHYSAFLKHPQSILIFDNMSSNTKVLEAYEKYADRITLIKFSFYFNRLQENTLLPELYQAIWDSSTFYTLVDTDEFLYLYDGDKIIADERILSLLHKSRNVSFFPTFWLKNAYCKDNVFTFRDDIEYIRYLLYMGKPILNSARLRDRLLPITTHGLHLPVSAYGKAPACFLLFHLSTLSKEQRIRVNMDKLCQYRVIKHPRDFHTVLNADLNTLRPGNVSYFIREIRKLLEMPDRREEAIGPGHLEIAGDGSLNFFPPSLREAFTTYVRKERSFFEILGIDPTCVANERTTVWELVDKETFDQKIPPQSKWEF